MEPSIETIKNTSDSVAFTIVEFIINQYMDKDPESKKYWPAEHEYILHHSPELITKIREVIVQNFKDFNSEKENLIEMHLMINQDVPNLVPIYLLVAAGYKGDTAGIWFIPRRMMFMFTREAYDMYKQGKGIIKPIDHCDVVLKYKFDLRRPSEKTASHDQTVS